MSRPGISWILGWLLVAALGTLGLWSTARSNLRESFELDARILHRVLSQRMEQQEAVLYAVEALSQQQVEVGTLSGYVRALIRPYPQIVAMEQCGRQGCRRVASSATTLPAVPVSQPANPTLLWPANTGSRYALALDRVRVWVDAEKLIAPEDLPKQPLTVQISRPEGGGLLVKWEHVIRPAALTLSVEKNLGTRLQAFPIRFERNYGWTVWPWGTIASWWAVTGLLLFGLARMLEARRQADQALQDERRRAQGIVQASTDGIVALDPAGRVVQANPAARQMLGDLPVGTDIQSAAPFQATLSQAPFDASAFWGSVGPRRLPEGTALRRAGESVLVEGAIAPLTRQGGQLLGRVLTVREVGPLQQRMLAQLGEGERRVREHEALLAHVSRLSTLGEMSAGLAHELNQPLTAVVSYGQAGARLLDGDDPDVPRARQALGAMVTQARRAAEIITRLRSLVRRAPPRRVQVDFVQAVQNILTLCHADIAGSGAELCTAFPARAALVRADPVQVEQIVLNLLRNALEALAGGADGQLTLELKESGESWLLTVQDNGPGLSPDALTHLFAPFNTAKAEGLGLGLSLSQTLAQGMGGDLHGGNAPDGGARFTLTLPKWEA